MNKRNLSRTEQDICCADLETGVVKYFSEEENFPRYNLNRNLYYYPNSGTKINIINSDQCNK